MIEQPPEDTSRGLEPKVRLIVETVREFQRFEAQLLAGRFQTPGRNPSPQRVRQWKSFVRCGETCCLSSELLPYRKSPSHTAMWYHYADQYRGVVLELRCDDELDSAWRIARPVTYPTSKPLPVYTADGWARNSHDHQESRPRRTPLVVITYTKSARLVLREGVENHPFSRPPEWPIHATYRLNPQGPCWHLSRTQHFNRGS